MCTHLILRVGLLLAVVGCSSDADSSHEAPGASSATSATQSPRPLRRNGEQILADTFAVRHDLRDGRLTLVLDTDMGDAATLMVSVSRTYRERGNTEQYVVNYFDERTTVGEWRLPRTLMLDQDAWNRELEQRQRMMAAAGEPFTVSGIADSIEISFVLPVNQDPPFQTWNANLIGEAVEQDGQLRLLRSSTKIRYPLGTKGVGQSRYADPLNLSIGTSYRSSGALPLMSELNPSDPLRALAASKQLQSEGTFRVLGRRMNRNIPWYRVEVAGVEYWVNSTALVGQQVNEVK